MNEFTQSFEQLTKNGNLVDDLICLLEISEENLLNALTLAQIGISLGIAKQLTQPIGRNIAIKYLSAEIERAEAINEKIDTGERLINKILPNYKRPLVQFVSINSKIKNSIASAITGFSAYCISKLIQKQLNKSTDLNQLLNTLIEDTWKLIPMLSAKDIDSLGVSHVFQLQKN